MLGLISLASLALSAATAVNGIVLPHGTAAARHAHLARDESTYDAAVLEPYSQYIDRYWKINCPSQHNTQFFDDCCHPLKKGETVERNRAPKCNPANLSSSAVSSPTSVVSSAAPSATDDGEDDEDCDGEDEPTTAAAPTTHTPTTSAAPAATSSAAPVNVAPEPPKEETTSKTSATHTPTPTTHAPTTSHTPTPTPTPAASSGSSSSDFEGTGTWFTQNGVAGACGTVHSDSAFIVALDYRKYGNTGERSQYCGKSLTITNKKNGNTQTATVADACPTCGKPTDLDLSVGLFKALSNNDLGLGVLDLEWHFD